MSDQVVPSFVVTDVHGTVIGTARRIVAPTPGQPSGFSVSPLPEQRVHEVDIPADLLSAFRRHGDVKRFHEALGEHLRLGQAARDVD